MVEKKRILIVDDDTEIRDLLEFDISSSGYFVDTACDGMEGLNKALNNKYDLILLDVMMPKMNGFDVCKNIRQAKINVPILMLTAKGTIGDKTSGFDSGADDYLVKPFGMMELVARVNAVLRRITKEKHVVLSNGNIKVDLEKHEAYVDNKEIVLTLKEYDLLVYFLSNLNKVISRDELIEKVWGVDFIGESRTIDVHVGTLRSKISSSNSVIQTVRGVGYRMEKLDEKEN